MCGRLVRIRILDQQPACAQFVSQRVWFAPMDYRSIQPDPQKLDLIGEAWPMEKLADDSAFPVVPTLACPEP